MIMYLMPVSTRKGPSFCFEFEPERVTDYTFTMYIGVPSSIPVTSNLSDKTLRLVPVSI